MANNNPANNNPANNNPNPGLIDVVFRANNIQQGPGWPGRLREAFDKFVTDLEANPGSYNVEDKSNDKVTVGLSAGSPNVVYASDRAKPLLERKIGPDEYKRDIGPAISRNADVKTLHDYTIEQAQKMHSLQVRKLFTYLRADPHANYNAKYFDNPVAPFVREANVFAHGFSLAFDALAIRGKRPLARTTKTAREDETARQSFIAIYRMAPEEALELVRLAVLRGESWATSNGPSRDMLRHINFIDGYFNWRNVFLEADRVLEPGVSHNIELEEWSMFTKVIMEVDPLFEAFLEAVYITARALQNVPGRNVSFANTVNDKAGLIKKRIVDFLNTDKIVGWVTLSETGASLDNVGSGDFARDFTKWAADPIRREPLAAYRNMLPATVRKLPDKKAPWDGDHEHQDQGQHYHDAHHQHHQHQHYHDPPRQDQDQDQHQHHQDAPRQDQDQHQDQDHQDAPRQHQHQHQHNHDAQLPLARYRTPERPKRGRLRRIRMTRTTRSLMTVVTVTTKKRRR
ncbi:hypothetical protein PG996_008109 [Apiospora saccharicola]|uniref:Uncharacterized protein n=1 Tax=Apiospora saccharicola TaxID=335842 RepID=A0ABR1UXN4_9PEZI